MTTIASVAGAQRLPVVARPSVPPQTLLADSHAAARGTACGTLLAEVERCAAPAVAFLRLQDSPACDAHVRRRLYLFTLGGGATGAAVAVATDGRRQGVRVGRTVAGLMVGNLTGIAAFLFDQRRRERAPGYHTCRAADGGA